MVKKIPVLLVLAIIAILILQPRSNKPVLLLVFNGKYVVEAENLLASITQNSPELLPLIQVCVSDDKSKEFAIKHNLHWFAMSTIEKNHTFMTPEFNFFMQRKLEAILHVLRKGQDVLYVDTDIVFLSNPLPEIDKKFDLNIQNDLCTPPYDQLYLCAGFMYIKSNLRTISFITSSKIGMIKSQYKTSDQCEINAILKRDPNRISWHILDVCKFPNGCRYFDNSDASCKKNQAIIVHNNHMVGMESKMERFNQHNLIFAD